MAISKVLVDEAGVVETFGVTEPLSVTCATPRDEAETKELLAYLDQAAPAESEEGWRERWEALVDLEQKVSDWLVSECGVNPEELDDGHSVCRVLTFGSFRLGILRPTSDIDTLVLIPSSVSRDRFFTDFISRILTADVGVTECVPVTDARVPIAKVKFRGIFLDILVASVPASHIKVGMESVDDSLIFMVDEKCMKSMNGIRVADKILRLVPDPATFREATRLVKHWAQRRCVYSNSVGYFGGVSWSMAVARVCQLYPNFSAKQIVERFFYTFANWPWEENRPILLCSPTEVRLPRGTVPGGQFKDWNPSRYASDRYQVMPVITPIFPSHNTTYNVTETQKQVMVDEIRRGKEMVQLMSLSGGDIGWADLCAPLEFFSNFSTFLRLTVSALKVDELARFKGLVESRVRSLVKCVEQLDKRVLVRPHPDFFPNLPPAIAGSFFMGIAFTGAPGTQIDLKPAVQQFISDTMEKSLAECGETDGLRLEIQCVDDCAGVECSGKA